MATKSPEVVPATKGTPLTQYELQILSWIEQVWYKTGTLPSTEAICDEFHISKRKLAGHTRKNQWKSSWEARGLPNPNLHRQQAITLSPKQLMVANVILNEHDRTALKRKLEMVGLSTAQFQSWMADPTFFNYLRSETDRRFKNTDIFAHQSLSRLVMDGDLNAIKYYFDITNRHTTQADSLNFSSILARLMEVLARYVTPGVLSQIADDLDEIMGSPQAVPQRIPSFQALDVEEINSAAIEEIEEMRNEVNFIPPVEAVNQSRDEIAKMAFSLGRHKHGRTS